jgi:chromate transporter
MHRDLVERKRWISESDYKEGLALAQVAPGPLAAQLAIYLGFVDYRLLGATVVGIAFVTPSFLMVLGLGWAYQAYGGIAWMQSVFYGVGASVIGIMAISAHKLVTKNIGNDKLLWAIFLMLATVTVVTQTEMAWLFIVAGILTWVVRCHPNRNSGQAHLSWGFPVEWSQNLFPIADPDLLLQITWFFAKAGAFVFGSGLAIVPFLYGGVVTDFQWLNEKQFVDAVAVAMVTPGPVVIMTGFIGYLVAGLHGAALASLATFVPCILITVIAAPHFRKHSKRLGLMAFVDGITAAAVGAIAGSVLVLGMRSITDIPTGVLALGTTLLLLRFKRLPEPVIVMSAALIGSGIYPLTHQ